MREECYAAFRWIPIVDGFPQPWRGDLMAGYRKLIEGGLFEPALHGFTHFNTQTMMTALREDSDRGRRARLLADNGIPYLASYTPEYNFALVDREAGERPMDEAYQSDWVSTGAKLFAAAFGHKPSTTCAPGYRSNGVTHMLWRKVGIESVQVVGSHPLSAANELVQVERNVSFEPALESGDVVAHAMRRGAARRSLRDLPIVICSHSINYITHFTAAAENGRALLRKLLLTLMEEFPDLRFANTKALVDAWKGPDSDWFSEPSLAQRFRRVGVA